MLRVLLLIKLPADYEASGKEGKGRKVLRVKQLTMHFYNCSKIAPSLRFPSQLFYTASPWFWFLS